MKAAIIMLLLLLPSVSGLLIGTEFLTDDEQSSVDIVLAHGCERRIIVFSPMPIPIWYAWSNYVTTTIYGAGTYTAWEMAVLLHHECHEPLNGVRHTWEQMEEEFKEAGR